MDRLRTTIRQFIYRLKKDYLTLNNVVLAVALLLCASWVWSAITTMSRNWELEQKLETRNLDLAKLQLEIQKLELEQQYYSTDEYKELIARAKHGKMAEGETMVMLPKNTKVAKEKYAESEIVAVDEVSNFASWMNFLFPETNQ